MKKIILLFLTFTIVSLTWGQTAEEVKMEKEKDKNSLEKAEGDEGLRVERGTSVSQEGYGVFGLSTGSHIAIDTDDIQRKSGTSYSTLYHNYFGGDVSLTYGSDGNSYSTYIGTRSTNEGQLNAYNALYAGGASKYVGIGISTPSTQLHVVASGSEIARFESTAGSKWISFHDGTSRKGILWSVGSDMVIQADDVGSQVRFQTEGNNDRMSIDANGVGIGTSSPSSFFHVAHPSGVGNGMTIQNTFDTDEWEMYVFTTNDLNLRFNGSSKGNFDDVSGNYTPASDLSLKTNIQPVENGIIEKIKLLKPSRYHFKNHTNSHKEYGLIAQEVQQVFPELTPSIASVSEGAQQDLLGVTYTEFVPILIKAIQEQQTQIEELRNQSELAQLRSENAELKERLARLEAAVEALTKE